MQKINHPYLEQFISTEILLHAEKNEKNFYLVKACKPRTNERYFVVWGNTTDEKNMGCSEILYDSGRKMSLRGAFKKFSEAVNASEFVQFKK